MFAILIITIFTQFLVEAVALRANSFLAVNFAEWCIFLRYFDDVHVFLEQYLARVVFQNSFASYFAIQFAPQWLRNFFEGRRGTGSHNDCAKTKFLF